MLSKKYLIGLLIATICMPQVADARCDSASKQMKTADAIFIGKVIGKEYVGYKKAGLKRGGVDEYAAANGQTPLWKWKINEFEVQTKYKGRLNDIIRVVSPRTFTVGGRYIIFATANKSKPRFSKTGAGWINDICNKSESLIPQLGESSLKEDLDDRFKTMRFK